MDGPLTKNSFLWTFDLTHSTWYKHGLSLNLEFDQPQEGPLLEGGERKKKEGGVGGKGGCNQGSTALGVEQTGWRRVVGVLECVCVLLAEL